MSEAPHNPFLDARDAALDGVVGRWSQSNEQWWDWYMSLAVGADAPPDALAPAPPLPELPEPSLHALAAELEAPLEVDAEAKARFRAEGFILLKDVVSPAALMRLRRAFTELFADAALPAMGFPSLEMMWTHDAVCRAFVLSRRLASLAGQLLGVEAVRIYHDNALSKSPGCGRTPWHYDAHHYPIASENVVTAWLPLQATPAALGPLVLARGIEVVEKVRALEFDKFGSGYDRAVIDLLEREGVSLEVLEYDLGDVSFHHTLALHSAAPNQTQRDRMALATTYFEDGARLVDAPTIISGDYEKFMPGVQPGEVIDTPLNPVVWRAGGAA
jgi:ectoine hydroxylase-related dioxygenase (phytanoyl-CoA dioxygenase family)